MNLRGPKYLILGALLLISTQLILPAYQTQFAFAAEDKQEMLVKQQEKKDIMDSACSAKRSSSKCKSAIKSYCAIKIDKKYGEKYKTKKKCTASFNKYYAKLENSNKEQTKKQNMEAKCTADSTSPQCKAAVKTYCAFKFNKKYGGYTTKKVCRKEYKQHYKALEEERQRQEAEAARKRAEEEQRQREAAAAAARQRAAQQQQQQSQQRQNSYNNNSSNTNNNSGQTCGSCEDGTYVCGNPSAKGRANACYGHGGWIMNH